MCVTAIANLIQTCQKESTNRTLFHKDRDIIPFIECHWESMTTMPRRVTQSWHSRVSFASFLLILTLRPILEFTFLHISSITDLQSPNERSWNFVFNG